MGRLQGQHPTGQARGPAREFYPHTATTLQVVVLHRDQWVPVDRSPDRPVTYCQLIATVDSRERGAATPRTSSVHCIGWELSKVA